MLPDDVSSAVDIGIGEKVDFLNFLTGEIKVNAETLIFLIKSHNHIFTTDLHIGWPKEQ